MTESNQELSPSILLFDGTCNLCNSAVRFIIKRDPKQYFRFYSLNSLRGEEILDQIMPTECQGNTVVLIDGGEVFTKSTAVLHIVRKLTFPWPLLYAFVLIPPPLRDYVYEIIARYRGRLFGTTATCSVMENQETANRFLEESK